MKFAFIAAKMAEFPMTVLCRALEVSRAGFYASIGRPPSARALEDRKLAVPVREAHERGRCFHGSPRVHLELAQVHQVFVTRKRVIRLTQQEGLRARVRKRFALDHFRIAKEHDPLSPWAWTGLGSAHFLRGEVELAKRAFRHALAIAPEHESALWRMAEAEYATGNWEESRAWWRRSALQQTRTFGAVVVEHALGHETESRAALEELIRGWGTQSPSSIAPALSVRGDRDLAFEWLERSFALHEGHLDAIKTFFFLTPLHSDPRWKPFLKKMNLPVD